MWHEWLTHTNTTESKRCKHIGVQNTQKIAFHTIVFSACFHLTHTYTHTRSHCKHYGNIHRTGEEESFAYTFVYIVQHIVCQLCHPSSERIDRRKKKSERKQCHDGFSSTSNNRRTFPYRVCVHFTIYITTLRHTYLWTWVEKETIQKFDSKMFGFAYRTRREEFAIIEKCLEIDFDSNEMEGKSDSIRTHTQPSPFLSFVFYSLRWK